MEKVPVNSWFHKILIHLYNLPLDDKYVLINSFLIKELNISEDEIKDAYITKSVLNYLQTKGFVLWNDNVKTYGAEPFGEATGKDYSGTFDTRVLKYHEIYIKLTLEGYDYVSEVKRQIEFHNSQVKTNTSNRIVGYSTIAVALLALIISVLTYFKPESKTLDVEQPLKLLLPPELQESINKSIKNLELMRYSLDTIARAFSDSLHW